MKYEAEIDGRQISIELERRDRSVSAMVDGRRYELEVLCPERGLYLIFAGERVYEARAWSAESDLFTVKLRDRVFSARVIDRKHRRSVADHSDEGRQQLTAPMPGKVVRLLREQGDEVEAGQGVVVVEAMKMQNEIKSTKAGRIVEIRVAAGDTVNANQVLAVVE
ncbi:MAG: biotin/lipoyl-binding protein [Blastocatellia bacterium]|nr:biotin/lipoyl-binding protein [Blastocatellia bacterium]